MNDPLVQNTPSPDAPNKNLFSSSRSLFFYTIVALGIALFIRFFIAAPYVVSGDSMIPTFENWDYLIVDRISYRLGDPARGEVVIFDMPNNPSKALVKRIIGLPGDTVIVKGNDVTIQNAEHPQGFMIEEPYLDPANLSRENDFSITIEDDQYFVLGDNRDNSADSRVWGTLPREFIVGRAYLRLYRFSQIGVFPGSATYLEE